MPDWCFTHLVIQHENENVIEKLEKLINEWTSKDYIENRFGKDWLGNIVGNSGIGMVGCEKNYNKKLDADKYVFCRGRIYDMDRCGNELSINEESAWSPALGLWLRVIDKYAKGAKLIYTAEEGGCGVYITNDEDYLNKYYVDWWESFSDEVMERLKTAGWESVEGVYDCSEEWTLKFLLALVPEETATEKYKIAKSDAERIDILIKALYETDLTDCCGVHRWDWVEPTECE